MSDEAPKRRKAEDVTLPDPDVVMSSAREALQGMREAALAKLQAAQDEVDAIDGKLSRIEAYFNPPATREPEPKARKPRATGKPRAPRQSGVRDNVLADFSKHPDGIKAADLIEAMGGKDNKAVETSIRNAVNALKKDGKISADKGHYKAL